MEARIEPVILLAFLFPNLCFTHYFLPVLSPGGLTDDIQYLNVGSPNVSPVTICPAPYLELQKNKNQALAFL